MTESLITMKKLKLNFHRLICRFLQKLRKRQNENAVVDSVADILVDFFSGSSAQKLKSAYGKYLAIQCH